MPDSTPPKKPSKTDDKVDKIKGFIQLAFVIAFIVGSFIASALLGVSKAPLREKEVPTRSLMVEAIQVTPGRHQITFSTTGLLKARTEVDISPEVSGRIITANDNAFSGGTFEAGELLFQIEPADYQLAVKNLEATVAQARTAYALEQAESKIALAEWTQLQGDKPAPALVARKPQLAEALATLKAAEAQLQEATLDLERTVFSLPFKGRIVSSTIGKGQYVSTGQSYGTAYALNDLEIQASLDQKNLAWLQEASAPEITITTTYKGEDHDYKGVLKRSAADLDTTTRFGQIAVGFDEKALRYDEASGGLLPGAFTALTIHGPILDKLIAVPVSAMQKGQIMWHINPADQTLESISPDIVYTDGETLLLRGFDAPSLIVTSKLSGGAPGIKVNYTLKDTPADLMPLESAATAEKMVMAQ